MNYTKACKILGLTSVLSILGSAQDLSTYKGCPPAGDGKDAKLAELDRKKNRFDIVDPNHAIQISMDDLRIPGEDSGRFKEGIAVFIEAYIVEVKPGGVESCNCHSTDPDSRDTHIALSIDPKPTQYRVIVEVTPRLRELKKAEGKDWSTKNLKKLIGKKVRITGWLFYDTEHRQNAFNTNTVGQHNWRVTCWEIHPITNIEVLDQ